MTIDKEQYSRFLEKVAEGIDIPPGKYQDAVDRYESVGRWLEAGQYPGIPGAPIIYPQGSFRLGTVVRPIRGGVEADYDIDLVCELQVERYRTDARSVKLMVGSRLREHGTYRNLLDVEGKRCWTLEYAEQDNIGFHLDTLPSISDRISHLDTSIAITDKQGTVYTWSPSNPKGFAEWFENINQMAFELVRLEQKRSIQGRASTIYASVDEVPDQLVRSPLQRSIQIMKRHRDLRFHSGENTPYAPISIIITTLAAKLYNGEKDIQSALARIVSELYAYSALIENQPVPSSLVPRTLIERTQDGRWHIANPVNAEENFADRWHEDNHARARAFFGWVKALKQDLLDVLAEGSSDSARRRLSTAFGASIVSPHFGLILPPKPTRPRPPMVRISNPARPWKA